jgi:hypothetical protein
LSQVTEPGSDPLVPGMTDRLAAAEAVRLRLSIVIAVMAMVSLLAAAIAGGAARAADGRRLSWAGRT